MELDNHFVRRQFPAFSEASLEGQAFFENAGGSYTCNQVIDRLVRFYRERKVQPYYPFEPSRTGGEEMDEARQRMAAMLGVETDEVSFGPSTTQNTYVLAQAFGDHLSAGDAIIVTDQDHEANSGPWRRLEKRGISIREWRIDSETGHLAIDDLKNLIDDKVKLICFPHCSNVVAEINLVAEVCALAKSTGAFTCVDGVSYAPHGFPNVGELGADIYLFSSYKTYGPHQGIMVVRRGVGEALPNQGHFFNADSLYKRFTPAGPDHAQVAACAGLADYVDALFDHHSEKAAKNTAGAEKASFVHDLMRNHEKKLLQPLLDYAAEKNSVRLLGPREAEKRAPTVTLVAKDPAEELATKLAPMGIMAGCGDFYGVRCLKSQGVDPVHGALRVSFVHYTSTAEVEKLINALDQVV